MFAHHNLVCCTYVRICASKQLFVSCAYVYVCNGTQWFAERLLTYISVPLSTQWFAECLLLVCSAQVWDCFGRNLYTSHVHDSPITSLAWSPDGMRVAASVHTPTSAEMIARLIT